MNHERVVVMGTLGVGKSTVSELLAQELHFHLMPEIINPVLSKFYDDPPKYAFQSQISCLTTKYNQTVEAAELSKLKPVLQDTPIHQDRIYAVAQHTLGNMTDAEMDLYENLYTIYTERVDVLPNLLIYIDAKMPVILHRIEERDRKCERKIDPKYVELLDQLNRAWLANNRTISVLPIETDHMDIVRDPVAKKHLVGLVQQQLHLYYPYDVS